MYQEELKKETRRVRYSDLNPVQIRQPLHFNQRNLQSGSGGGQISSDNGEDKLAAAVGGGFLAVVIGGFESGLLSVRPVVERGVEGG